jgi:transcriptional regulator with GAF, ATPase, and Fis domain
MRRPSVALSADEKATRIESLEWMAEHGETVEGAARRLGLKPDTLEHWARNNVPATYQRMVRNAYPTDVCA